MERKTEIPGIFKPEDGVLINKDVDALKSYKKRKMRENKINDLIKMESDISSLKSDMEEIKQLLKGLSR